MANYTKQDERKRGTGEAIARMRNERFTIFSDDYDPHLTLKNLTMERAITELKARSGISVFLYRSRETGTWGFGTIQPEVHQFLGPSSGGKVRWAIYSKSRDLAEAKVELGHAVIGFGLGSFRGMPNLTFEQHYKLLRAFVSLEPMASADQYNAAKKRCSERDLQKLALYGTRMRNNIMREL